MGKLGRGLIGLVITATGSIAAWQGYQHWQQRQIWAELQVAQQLEKPQSWQLMPFIAQWDGRQLTLTDSTRPDHSLWSTEGGFIAAGIGSAKVEEHRGAFFVTEHRQVLCQQQVLESIRQQGPTLLLSGKLTCTDGMQSRFLLSLEPTAKGSLQLDVKLDNPRLNRLYLSWTRQPDEHFFGFGEQFSRFDLSGTRLPILVQEQGIGRGLQPITLGADLSARAGGSWSSSYAPIPHYLTSKLRSLFSESTAYQIFDLRDEGRVQLEVHEPHLRAHIYSGSTPSELIEAHTAQVGRMRPLPGWTQKGAIVGLQGGTARVRKIIDQLGDAGVPLAGIWIQDWVGQRTTSFGKQLWWNWTLDQQHYPDWPELQSQLKQSGIRTLAYVNPFLVDVAQKQPAVRNLYHEAKQHNFLVKDSSGEPLALLNTSFSAGLLDITNPAARSWFKQTLSREMLAAGFSGWMADFAEALPFDAQLASGESAALFHNRFPEEWARLNRELIEEAGGADELLFFTRAGFSRSPGLTTSMWLGDQLVTWDAHDGLHSSLLGLLSGGLSGFSLNHSDIGGYTTINNPLKNYHRSEELLLRWMEMNAFTSLFRSHEGNRPEENRQVYDSPRTLQHFARFASIFASLAPYRQQLMVEASQRGLPLVRPLWLHYPDDPASVTDLPRSFLLGQDLLMAPVLESGVTQLEVALPAGNWIHLWSGKRIEAQPGTHVEVDTPLGQPAVFYRENSQAGTLLTSIRSQLP